MLFSTPEEAAWQAEAQYEYQRRCAAANTPGLVPHPDQDNSLQMVLRQRAPQYLISHQQTIQTSWQAQDNWAALGSLQQLPSATAAASQFVPSLQQSTQPPPSLLKIESYAENIVEEFGEYYGKDVNDLGALERLCGAFGIVPSSTIQGCITVSQIIQDMFGWLADHYLATRKLPHEHIRRGGAWWQTEERGGTLRE